MLCLLWGIIYIVICTIGFTVCGLNLSRSRLLSGVLLSFHWNLFVFSSTWNVADVGWPDSEPMLPGQQHHWQNLTNFTSAVNVCRKTFLCSACVRACVRVCVCVCVMSVWKQFSLRWYLCAVESRHAHHLISEVCPVLLLEKFQCWSDWQRRFLVL